MMSAMSLQTTLARATARATARLWRDHWYNCPVCERWVRRRMGNGCTSGRLLRRDDQEAQAELAEQRELDKQPAPGQGELWSGNNWP